MRRIIPADAGSTQAKHPKESDTWDHPRGCGEHVLAPDVADSVTGSSPRMRGAPDGLTSIQHVGRIIPADAGSTPRQGSRPGAVGDHPRGCGEHVTFTPRGLTALGSSPRMRGAQEHADQEHQA